MTEEHPNLMDSIQRDVGEQNPVEMNQNHGKEITKHPLRICAQVDTNKLLSLL